MQTRKRSDSSGKKGSREGITPEYRPQPRKKTKTPPTPSPQTIKLQDYSHILRIQSIQSVNVTKSGHPTSCSSIAEIMAVLFFSPSGMNYNRQNHRDLTKDRFILSKGHAAPIYYAALAYAGMIPYDLLKTLRLKGSLLQGHPVPRIPFTDTATGSLGQGLGVAAGMAYSCKFYQKVDNRIWCIIGDGQSMQGSIWQAAAFASHYELNNLIAICDVNRLGQSDPTALQHKLNIYKAKWDAFGWTSYIVDGHNIVDLQKDFEKAKKNKTPTIILAKTFKGKYFPNIEDKLNFHGTAVNSSVAQHIRTLITADCPKPLPYVQTMEVCPPLNPSKVNPNYKLGQKLATRKAYGNALVALNESNKDVLGLDGDTKNSTFSIKLKEKYPESFIQCFIAEQNIVSVATGLAARNKIPFCSTFSAFFSRAADQIRILGISQKNVKLVGSHVGVSIGEDGPSQMALQDLAFFRTIPYIHIFYPSDAVSCERACQLAANHYGIDFIRTSRQDCPVIYSNDQVFQIGKSKTILKSQKDSLCVISGGVPLHQCIAASNILKGQGINIRLIDLFSVKPIDKQGIIKAALESNATILTGGLREAVASAVSETGKIRVFSIAVQRIPSSATPSEQLQLHGLDSHSIVKKIKEIIA